MVSTTMVAMAEWLRQRPAKPFTRVRFPLAASLPNTSNSSHGRLAQLVARFPDTEEVTGSSPVPPTS